MKYEFRVSFDSDEERSAFVRALHGATSCLFAKKTPEDSEKAVAILMAGVKAELVEVDAAVSKPINKTNELITRSHDYDCSCVDCDLDDDCERLICDCPNHYRG